MGLFSDMCGRFWNMVKICIEILVELFSEIHSKHLLMTYFELHLGIAAISFPGQLIMIITITISIIITTTTTTTTTITTTITITNYYYCYYYYYYYYY